jgi:hypothetical protein
VYETIKLNPMITDKEISEISGIPINVVTPRRGELLQKRFIINGGITIQDNGHSANTWKVAED